MEDKKDFGNIFRDRLSNAEIEPNKSLWGSIEKTLGKKRRKRIGFIWFWSGLVAFIGILSVYSIIEQKEKSDYIKNEKQSNTETEKNKEINPENKSSTNKSSYYKSHKNKDSKTTNFFKDSLNEANFQSTNNRKSSINENKKKVSISSKGNFDSRVTSLKNQKNEKEITPVVKTKNNATTKNTKYSSKENSVQVKNKNLPNTIAINNRDSIVKKVLQVNDSSAKKELPKRKKKEEENVKPIKKALSAAPWMISVQASPTYYNYLLKGNPYEQSLAGGTLIGNISYSYGALINIPISDKITFRFGYRKSNFSFKIENALNELSNERTFNLLTDKAIERNGLPVPNVILNKIYDGEMFDIEQKMEYHEIPLELNYTLNKNKVTIDAITGIGLMILGDNAVHIKNEAGIAEIGTIKYLKKATITPIIGIGIRYALTEKIRLDVEPILQYQIDTFEKEFRNQHPFIFRLQTGITLKL
ncbi:MAG: hypothetical protein NWP64_03420 [Maribacter sp.]|nr:hypothetical protein [Maribacter sp.]